MPFVQHVMPQYRDADEDGLIGLRGCMRYFQDIHTWFMHSYHKGNDELPEQYGAGWVYTRYHIQLKEKMDYTDSLTLTAWLEPYRQPVLVNVCVTVSQHGRVKAQGRLECCIFHIKRRRPLRLSAVDFPEGVAEEIENDIPAFMGLDKSAEGMTPRYTRPVRVSDIDKNRHMNNLRYVEMFQDAYDSAFWENLNPNTMEIAFLSQTLEGESLLVSSRPTPDGVYLAAEHVDGKLASVAFFGRGQE